MVHKKFVNLTSTRESTWIDRTPHPAARNYLDEMAPINGIRDDDAASIRLRDNFRDEVSKRMGELLLKGQTMLDEYCPTCSGILMEDRALVRRCVTCELFREKSSVIVGEVSLQDEDLNEAVNNKIPTPAAPVNKPAKKAVLQKSAPAKKKEAVPAAAEPSSSDTIESATTAVLQKLEWATDRLNSTEEVARVMDFLSVIQKSAETLKALRI